MFHALIFNNLSIKEGVHKATHPKEIVERSEDKINDPSQGPKLLI